MVKRLERIRDLSSDLVRDLSRDHGDGTDVHRDMINAIKREADALHRASTHRTPRSAFVGSDNGGGSV
jgi:hypothetical protein